MKKELLPKLISVTEERTPIVNRSELESFLVEFSDVLMELLNCKNIPMDSSLYAYLFSVKASLDSALRHLVYFKDLL